MHSFASCAESTTRDPAIYADAPKYSARQLARLSQGGCLFVRATGQRVVPSVAWQRSGIERKRRISQESPLVAGARFGAFGHDPMTGGHKVAFVAAATTPESLHVAGDKDVSEAKQAIGAWFASYNRRDLPSLRELIHVPYVELRGSLISIVEQREQYQPEFPADAAGREVYTAPVAVRVCRKGPDDVVLEIESQHMLVDRRPVGALLGLYFMVKKDGRWGIRAVSLHNERTNEQTAGST